MNLDIRGRTALVTGGNRGIGKAAAIELAKEGCNVVILGRNRVDLEIAEREIRAIGANALAITCDVENAKEVETAVKSAFSVFGKVDILFNNAGYAHPCTPISATDEEWMSQLNVHLMACVRTCRLIIPKMIEQKWGRIINMSSMYGIAPGTGVADYNAAKAAVINYTRSLALEYSRFGICATAVCPGLVHTESWDKTAENIALQFGSTREKILKATAAQASSIKRYARPEEVAKVIAFLASECSSFVTGCSVQVDGGALAGIEIAY